MDTVSEIIGNNIVLFWPSFVGVTMIALVHLLTPRIRFIQESYDLWTPVSAGVALAYVFTDIFPHLAEAQKLLGDIEAGTLYGFLAHNVYVVALAGFCLHLGVVLLSIEYRQRHATSELTYRYSPTIVKTETISLALYNFLIGYILSEQITHRPEPVILFAMAMTIHFIGINRLMREHFQNLYERTARFLFCIAVYAGWLAGVLFEISNAALAIVYAFLAGGIIVVATVYELPGVQSKRQYVSFLSGAALFSALVLLIDYF